MSILQKAYTFVKKHWSMSDDVFPDDLNRYENGIEDLYNRAIEQDKQIGDLSNKSFKAEGTLPNNTDFNDLKSNYPYSSFVLNPSFNYINCPDLFGQWAVLEINGQSSIIKVLNKPIIYYCSNNSMGNLSLEWQPFAIATKTDILLENGWVVSSLNNDCRIIGDMAHLNLRCSNGITTQGTVICKVPNSPAQIFVPCFTPNGELIGSVEINNGFLKVVSLSKTDVNIQCTWVVK